MTAGGYSLGLGELIRRRPKPRRQRLQVQRWCDICGHEFMVSARSSKRRCSPECQAEAVRRWHEEKRRAQAAQRAAQEGGEG